MRDQGKDCLYFAVLHNQTLGTQLGGSTGEPINLRPIPLHISDGRPNHNSVAAYAALTGKTVNIADAYTAEGFDFSSTEEFDQNTGYRSRSFLTVPMKDHEENTVGVLELINAKSADGKDTEFSETAELWIESLASQAAVALDEVDGEVDPDAEHHGREHRHRHVEVPAEQRKPGVHDQHGPQHRDHGGQRPSQ